MPPTKITSKAVDADAKYPIDVDKIDGYDAHASATANQLLVLDGSSQLPASADMVDGKHWADMKSGSVTFVLGNKENVIAADEIAAFCFNFACTITEIHIRELTEISGSVALSIGRADSDSDDTWVELNTPSLSSQWFKAVTGLSYSIDIGDWVRGMTTGIGTSTKQIAISLFFDRT